MLGQYLFLTYINDLPDHLTCNARIVADDTAVDRKIKTLVDTVGLKRDLDSLQMGETMGHDVPPCQMLCTLCYKSPNQD